jgi:hypothetical protein
VLIDVERAFRGQIFFSRQNGRTMKLSGSPKVVKNIWQRVRGFFFFEFLELSRHAKRYAFPEILVVTDASREYCLSSTTNARRHARLRCQSELKGNQPWAAFRASLPARLLLALERAAFEARKSCTAWTLGAPGESMRRCRNLLNQLMSTPDPAAISREVKTVSSISSYVL